MDVSIIIVNWNTRELLLDCLSSVDRTTAGITFETIVVDNGSHDGSPQAVRKQFPQVKLIQNEENRGFARANNQALAGAAGRYVLLLNSDVQLTDGALNKLVAFMDTTPGAGIAACQYLNQDESTAGFLTSINTQFPSLYLTHPSHPNWYCKYPCHCPRLPPDRRHHS